MLKKLAAFAFVASLMIACGAPLPEMTPEQIAFQKKIQENKLLSQTVDQPGGAAYEKGTPGGTWQDSLFDDPKTLNPVLAKDSESNAIITRLEDPLLTYDPYKKIWKPEAASVEIKTDEKTNTMDLVFTLRDDLYWATLAEPDKTVKVTSDDVIFWYNEIDGDPAMGTSAYSGHFLTMPDKTKKPITIEKLDDRRFVFHFPEIVAFPEESANLAFGPRYVFEPVKKAKGAQGVKELWSVATDPRTIPSMGPYFLDTYRPGIGATLTRNPHFWKRDAWGQSIPYIAKIDYKIVPNQDTQKLKFQSGTLDSFNLRPQDMEELIQKSPKDYTVYYAGPSPGTALFGWNENPKTLDPVKFKWFSNVKFRRALASLFNRKRVISQVYRDLASPALDFFPSKNPYFNPAVKLKDDYNPGRAQKLLAEEGFTKRADGILVDSTGHPVSFDLLIVDGSNTVTDLCNIYIDELKKAGITMKLVPVDFQKYLTKLTETYDWDAAIVSFGAEEFPIDGINVWVSDGDLHFWYPHQAAPATPWESHVDDLYHRGYVTRDPVEAMKIWTDYQQTLLDNVPVFPLIHRDGFMAVRNKWGNVRVDQTGSPDFDYVYLKP